MSATGKHMSVRYRHLAAYLVAVVLAGYAGAEILARMIADATACAPLLGEPVRAYADMDACLRARSWAYFVTTGMAYSAWTFPLLVLGGRYLGKKRVESRRG